MSLRLAVCLDRLVRRAILARPIESCVKTKIERSFISAAIRKALRA